MRTVEVPGELELVGSVLGLAGYILKLGVPVPEFPVELAADGKRGGSAIEGAVGTRAPPGEPFWIPAQEIGLIDGLHEEVDVFRTVARVYREDGERIVHELVSAC